MRIKAIFFDMGGVLLPLFPDRCMDAYRELAGFTPATSTEYFLTSKPAAWSWTPSSPSVWSIAPPAPH